MDNYRILMIIAVVVIAAISVVLTLNVTTMSLATQDYAIYVDPLIDEQGLFTMARVTIQNTGSKDLTNVKINWGDGQTDKLGTLHPGQKIIASPPSDNKMQFVQVSADPDIFVSKAYRSPPKMVGMMGS